MVKVTLRMMIMAFGGILIEMPQAHTAIIVAGVTFDDNNAFADTVISFQVPTGEDPNDAVGSDMETFVDGMTIHDPDPRDFVELRFTNNVVVNAAGDDLAFFEIGDPEPILVSLTVGGAFVSVPTAYTLEDSFPSGRKINVGFLDLSDLGVADGAIITSIVANGAGTQPEFAGVGALNSVPEPSTVMLTALALLGLISPTATAAAEHSNQHTNC